MRSMRAPGPVLALLFLSLAGCSGEAKLPKADLVRQLENAGFRVEEVDSARVFHEKDRAKLSGKPISIFSIRLTDAQGNSEVATPIELGSAEEAREQKEQRINGFAHRNWFFAGILSVELQDRIRAALPVPAD